MTTRKQQSDGMVNIVSFSTSVKEFGKVAFSRPISLTVIHTEQIMREADLRGLGISIGGRNVVELRYADDTCLIGINITQMRKVIGKVNRSGKKAGLELNEK